MSLAKTTLLAAVAEKIRTPGVIRADEAYTQAEFCRRAGLARKAYQAARRHGLTVIEFGKKRWVRGADWLAFLEKQAEKQTAST